jgi:hypothetical protein
MILLWLAGVGVVGLEKEEGSDFGWMGEGLVG